MCMRLPSIYRCAVRVVSVLLFTSTLSTPSPQQLTLDKKGAPHTAHTVCNNNSCMHISFDFVPVHIHAYI